MADLYTKIRKELFIKMKIMDPTIKGIKESLEYKEAAAYNAGIRDAISILDSYNQTLAEVGNDKDPEM
ncbi:hypothetical protein IMSAGC019_03109 [Lachnospiraceae bacterium]|nr:hypothetical protein IMSAGC019_03109 [Lachnospiraceae bacterium]